MTASVSHLGGFSGSLSTWSSELLVCNLSSLSLHSNFQQLFQLVKQKLQIILDSLLSHTCVLEAVLSEYT